MPPTFELVNALPVDPPRAARLILLSSPQILEAALGGREEKALSVIERLYEQKDNLFSHEHCRVVLRQDELVGLLLGYSHRTREAERGHTGFLLLRMLGRGAFLRRVPLLLRLDSVLSRTQPGDFYISNLAVAEENRGQGLAGRLLAAAALDARQGGLLRIVLEVESGNQRAFAFYRRTGFRFIRMTNPVRLGRARPFVQFHLLEKTL